MDTKELFELIDKFDHSGLSLFKYHTEKDNIVLKKSITVAQTTQSPEQVAAPVSNEITKQTPVSAGNEIVTAPIVGTFYRSPSPDSPPFVEEGSIVKAGDTICIIEAMKMMNALEAEFDMEIVSILVESGAMVEYGAPLLEVTRQ